MKEIFFVIQFLLSQEFFYTEDGIAKYPIDGRMAISNEKLYFVIDDVHEEYDITALSITDHNVLATFDEEGVFGTIIADKYLVRFEAAYFDYEEGTVDWVKIQFKVKQSNVEQVTVIEK
jgi:hypothetical protein